MLSDVLGRAEAKALERLKEMQDRMREVLPRIGQPDFDPQCFLDALSDLADGQKEFDEIMNAIDLVRHYV